MIGYEINNNKHMHLYILVNHVKIVIKNQLRISSFYFKRLNFI